MTDEERQQYIADLGEALGQLEFRVQLGNAIVDRLRREFWLVNVVFWLSGCLAGALAHAWWGH
jgi:hypothetical protein